MVTWLVDHVLGAPSWLVYLVVGLLVFAEDALFVGFVIPGETLAIIGGVTASLGKTSLAGVMAVVVIAAIVGDSVGYEIGRALGPRILAHRAFESRRERLETAQDFLARRGGTAVFLARWTAFFRAVMPALAGSSRMPYPRFLIWNAAGGVAWGGTVVLIGYFAGRSYDRVAGYFGKGVAVVLAVLAIAGLIVWRVRRSREDSHQD